MATHVAIHVPFHLILIFILFPRPEFDPLLKAAGNDLNERKNGLDYDIPDQCRSAEVFSQTILEHILITV